MLRVHFVLNSKKKQNASEMVLPKGRIKIKQQKRKIEKKWEMLSKS
jgi:hypothetical protein